MSAETDATMLRLAAVCRAWHDQYHVGAIFPLCSHHLCQEAVNAVTLVPAAGSPEEGTGVAVSDSQETPPEGREE